jgi:hypothetical protein
MQEISFESINKLSSFIAEQKELTILEITGEGCGFCAEQEKHMEKLEFLDTRIKGFKLNLDHKEHNAVHSEIAESLNIDVLPSTMFIHEGNIVEINDPGVPTTPFAYVCALSFSALKKLSLFILEKRGSVNQYFFGIACRACRSMKGIDKRCSLFNIKMYPDDSCDHFKRNMNYTI